MAFQENAIAADEVREEYIGEFIAVCDKQVVAHDYNEKSLIRKIPDECVGNLEMFIGYITEKHEFF